MYVYTRSSHQLFVSASLPSKTEPLVPSFHEACVSRTLCRISQGIWHNLQRRALERKVVCGQFHCCLALFCVLSPSAKREVLSLFQDPFPAVHLPSTASWTHLRRKPKCNERNHQRVLCKTRGSWSPNCLVSKSFSCSSSVNSRVAFGLLPKPL